MENTKASTRTLILSGLFVAASIILTRFFGFMLMGGTIRISLGAVPIALAGIMLGPAAGVLVGIVADLVGVMLLPQGSFFPGFTVSSALQGLIPAIFVYRAYVDSKVDFSRIAVLTAMSILLSTIIVSLGLNTLWLSILFQKGFMALLPTRFISSGIIAVASYVIIVVLLKSLRGKI